MQFAVDPGEPMRRLLIFTVVCVALAAGSIPAGATTHEESCPGTVAAGLNSRG